MPALAIPPWVEPLHMLFEPHFEVPGLERSLPERTERNFNETEPNNTLDDANDLGRISPSQDIHISGHVNGSSDPDDYFVYEATEPGTINVTMHRDNSIVYNENFTAEQANDQFYYYAWASGNADFDYSTDIAYTSFQDIQIA